MSMPAREADPAADRWTDYFAVNWRPALDSLLKRINSLMARFNSLLGRNKFPVSMRRELGRKPLNLSPDSELIVALGGPDEQNSL
jgi:hypothetical protein